MTKRVPFRIEGMSFEQQGESFLLFTATVAELLRFVEVIPNTDEHPDYPQRQVDYRRLRKIGDYVLAGGFLLPSIILNFYDTVDVEWLAGAKARITIPDDGSRHAYCLDGQHRLFTFDREKNPRMSSFTSDDSYQIPVVAMVDEDKHVWHDQFVIINTEQKPVNKNQILFMEEHFDSERLSPERARAVRIAEMLNQRRSCALYRKIFIRDGDEGTLVKLRNFVKVIEKHFDANGVFGAAHSAALSDESVAMLLEGYVNAIYEMFPEEWASKQHIMTKTAGWQTLFGPDGVMPVAFRRAKKKIDPAHAKEQWANALSPLTDLEINLGGEWFTLDWRSYKFGPYSTGQANIDKFVRAVRSAFEDA
jgi:DGQHR domain-containing protein